MCVTQYTRSVSGVSLPTDYPHWTVIVHGCAVRCPLTGCQVTSRPRDRFLRYSKWLDTFWMGLVHHNLHSDAVRCSLATTKATLIFKLHTKNYVPTCSIIMLHASHVSHSHFKCRIGTNSLQQLRGIVIEQENYRNGNVVRAVT